MHTISDLLDAIKQTRNIETDSALASALGVSRQTVNNWRQGRNTPDAVACATIAGLSGQPLNVVIGIAGEQRAVSREEKAVWRKLASSAMLFCLAMGLVSHAFAMDPFKRSVEVNKTTDFPVSDVHQLSEVSKTAETSPKQHAFMADWMSS